MSSVDRIKGGLEAFVRSVMHRIDYFALYPAKVVAQNADGSLELQPDDTRLPAHSQVPIRLGIPGAKVSMTAGSRVLLGFAGGRPESPIATLWEQSTVTKLSFASADIRLGADDSSEAVALASKVKAELDAFINTYNGHGHNVVTAGTAAAQTGTTDTPKAGALAAPTPTPPLALPGTQSASNSTGSSRTKTEL